jgi:AAA15 family ATPase/GTPase
MLRKIKISNFYSVGEEQELSLQISAKDVLDDSARAYADDDYINVVSCIVGPNASGKTTFLKAFGFLAWFTEKSYSSFKPERMIPIEQHKLHKKNPTRIEIEFYEDTVLYRYGIELNKKHVLSEQLEKRVKKFTSVFKLVRDGEQVEITSNKSLKINDSDAERIKSRPNISLLSALIDLGYLPEITFFKKFDGNVGQAGHHRIHHLEDSLRLSSALNKNEALQQEILAISKDIELGISEFKFQEVTFKNPDNPDEQVKEQILRCVHTSKKGSFSVPIFEESNGTQRSYCLLSEIIPVLKSGGLIVLDEIEDGLHPYVAKKIIALFESKDSNPHNAQLIFATHQHLLLNDRTKTQIFITEKNPALFETELYRLDDVEGVRNDENYFHKYMAGAYGGTPNIKWM